MADIGERIKLQRLASQMSLQQLAEYLSQDGIAITKGTLSNYENNRSVPNESVLKLLAQEMGTTVEFLTKKDPPDIQLSFLSTLDAAPLRVSELTSYVQVNLEKMLSIDELLHIPNVYVPLEKCHIRKGEEAETENVAEAVRKHWALGDYPISGVCGALEKNGWYLVWIPDNIWESCVAGWEEVRGLPFIAYKTPMSVVDMRIQLLETAANFFVEGEDEAHTKKLCRRFARAVLFPQEQVRQEFGQQRERVLSSELTLLKQKYGIGKFEIMHRMKDLGIISNQLYTAYISTARSYGYPSNRDSFSEIVPFNEMPMTYQSRVLASYAKGIIDAQELQFHRLQVETYTYELRGF